MSDTLYSFSQLLLISSLKPHWISQVTCSFDENCFVPHLFSVDVFKSQPQVVVTSLEKIYQNFANQTKSPSLV